MKTDATKFVCPGGLSYPQAVTLADQIDAAEPSAEQLVSGFFPDYLAVELAKQIRTGRPDTERLREMMMGPELISAIAAAINARHSQDAAA